MPVSIPSFKAYDIRGRLPDQLNADFAYRIANATAVFLDAKRMVVGRDIRLSSPEIADAVCKGLTDAGVDVIDIGLGGTEMVYFATGHLAVDGGIMVTASHNPKDYNGLKLVREQSKPISADTGLQEIRVLAERDDRSIASQPGSRETHDIMADYVARLLEYVDIPALKPLKIVVNAGNGGAGAALDAVAQHLPFEFIRIHHEPDGHFPNGVPNPMLEDNRLATAAAVVKHGADFGVAWDGDFDRCFLFDGDGGFIEGYYIVGLLAQVVLAKTPGVGIVHDPRLTWNTIEIVEAAGGEVIQSKSGHSFMKQVMREHNAGYGGEMSAHHYFRDFFYCDSGMIPWMLIGALVSQSGQTLKSLVAERIARFPASGEINRRVDDAKTVMDALWKEYSPAATHSNQVDGISIEFADWRFNLRASNTEPVIRLNVETRADQSLLSEKTDELLKRVGGKPA